MTWQTTTGNRATPLADYRWLREHVAQSVPPAHTVVRLAHYVGDRFPFTGYNFAHTGNVLGGAVDLEGDPEGHWAILNIGRLAFEILASRDGRTPDVHLPNLSGPVMIDLWPSVVARQWPPPHALDDQRMAELTGITLDQLPPREYL